MGFTVCILTLVESVLRLTAAKTNIPLLLLGLNRPVVSYVTAALRLWSPGVGSSTVVKAFLDTRNASITGLEQLQGACTQSNLLDLESV